MITIKDVCALLGIAPSTIRLYEKHLPDIPWSIEDNGYRNFRFENVMHLMDCRTLIKEGLSVKEAFEVSAAGSVEAKLRALDHRSEELADEIRRLSDLLVLLDEQRSLVSRIPRLLEECEIVDIPSFFFFSCTSYRVDPDLSDLVARWAASVPFAWFGVLCHLSECAVGRCEPEKMSFGGFGIPLRFADRVSTGSPSVSHIPACRCVAAVTEVGEYVPPELDAQAGFPYREDVVSRAVTRLGRAAAREGYELRGDCYMRLIHAEYTGSLKGSEAYPQVGAPTCYLYTWTPLLEEGPAFDWSSVFLG